MIVAPSSSHIATWLVAGAYVARTAEFGAVLAIQRPVTEAPYSDEELTSVRQLLPHLGRAARLSFEVARLRMSTRAVAAGLDYLDMGVLFLALDERVIVANERAHRIVGSCDGLAFRDRRLVATAAGMDRVLAAFIRARITESASREELRPTHLAVRRPSGRFPYSLRVVPVPRARDFAADAVALVLISDPGAAVARETTALREAFSLSAAEAEVALLLCDGANTTEIANRLGMQANTVRAHLKHIFSKTGARHQAELVALLLRGALANAMHPARDPAADDRPRQFERSD